MTEMPDADRLTQDLVDRARAGDREAFDRLFERAARRALLFVELRLGPELRQKLDPMDVLQDAYVDAAAAFPRFEYRGPDSFSKWLCRIIESRIRGLADWHGAAKRRPARPAVPISRALDELRASQTGPATAAGRDEWSVRVAAAMANLDPDEHEVLLLRFFQDRTVEEIAAVTGRSASAVRRLLGRAVARMGTLLGEE